MAVSFLLAALLSVGSGLVRNKLLAEGFGPVVLGWVGQLSTLTAVSGGLTFLCLWTAGLREFSRTDGADVTQSQAAITRLTLASSIAVPAVVVTILAASPSLLGLEGTPASPWLLVGLTIAAGWSNLAGVALRGRNQGSIALASAAAAAVCSTGLTVAAVALDYADLAVAGLWASFLVPATYWLWITRRWVLSALRDVKVPGSVYRALVPGVSLGVLALISRSGSDLASRSVIVAQLGDVANGLAQPAFLLTTVLTPQLVSLAASPIMRRWKGSTAEQAVGARSMTPVLAMLIAPYVILTLGAPLILSLVFSSRFLSVTTIFAATAVTEVARLPFNIWLQAAVRVHREWLAAGVVCLSGSGRLIIFLIALPELGLMALPVSLAVEGLLGGAMLGIALRRTMTPALAATLFCVMMVGVAALLPFTLGAS